MHTDRPFEELNLWQLIFAENWEPFLDWYRTLNNYDVPDHWEENVQRMLSCGDVREGYNEYLCEDCHRTTKVGFTCKSRLCLRCFKGAVDNFLNKAKEILFEGVTHRQLVLTIPVIIRPLLQYNPELLKVFVNAGAAAIKELVEEWRKSKRVKIGLMCVPQLHGRSGNFNPHLHFIVSDGGVDKNGNWCNVNFFDTRKLRKKWQYHVISALRKAIKGTVDEEKWSPVLGNMFRRYPNGFDCDAMPEKGPVERLVVYLCKYVSSPPISIRRIENYDGSSVTFRYEDHRKGTVRETIPAVEFIFRMIQHLPAKGFRMVRYFGIYARPVRNKIHSMVVDALNLLVETGRKIKRCFGKDNVGKTFGKSEMTCSHCGSTDMRLIRTWSKTGGMIYDAIRDDPVISQNGKTEKAQYGKVPFQLQFAF
ncbi:MAG TPA: hypothetical protein ENH53_04720 [Bacteroidetes bacterium]|nr:hypothetical protein [Bacteroidota bacterium]